MDSATIAVLIASVALGVTLAKMWASLHGSLSELKIQAKNTNGTLARHRKRLDELPCKAQAVKGEAQEVRVEHLETRVDRLESP